MGTRDGSYDEKAPAIERHASAGEKSARRRVSIVLERTIFYTLLVLIVLSATPYGIVNPWRGAFEALFQCAIFALGILWMIEGMLSGGWIARRHLLLVPLTLLAAFAYAQTFSLGSATTQAGINEPLWQAISFDPYESRLMVLKLLAYALLLGMLLRYARARARFRVLVMVVIGVCVASALFAVARQAVQRGTPDFLFPFVRLDRGYGQFVNRNHFAFLMEMGLGLVLGFIAGGARRDRALVYLAAALPMWTALVLSNSRGGILSMLCQLVMLALLFGVVRGRNVSGGRGALDRLARIGSRPAFRLVLVASLLAAALVGIIWVGGEQTVSRFETLRDEVAASESDAGVRRREIWAATWRMIKEHPLTGVGVGGYWTAFPQYHRGSGKLTPQQAHNDYLELAASGGIVGVLLGGWFVVLLVKFARDGLRAEDSFRRAACFGAVIGIFGIAVHSLVDFGLHIPVNALVCLSLVAIVALSVGAEDDERRAHISVSGKRA